MTTEMVKTRLDKLSAKLNRIDEALATGKNPYYYHESDRKNVLADLAKANEDLIKAEAKDQLKAQLEAGKVEIIERFLDEWEARVIEYYRRKVQQVKEFEKENPYNTHAEWRVFDKALRDRFSNLIINYSKGYQDYTADTARDKAEKRQMFYFRIREITGTIVDEKYLTIGDNGEINGIVYGEIANAKINTISAGGWNIQCFHFRVLVTKF